MLLQGSNTEFVTLHCLGVVWIFGHLLLYNELRCH
jgi:hypothetical protein